MKINFKFPKKKMKKLDIAGIFLIGSQAQGIANENSDFDFAVLLKNQKILNNDKRKSKIYNELYDILSEQINKLRNIDIIFIQNADLQFKYHVVKDGILLYLDDQKLVSDFLTNTMINYADFAPLRQQFNKAILERI